MTTSPTITSKIAAEFLGMATITAAIIGSGIMASNLSRDLGVMLFMNAFATMLAFALVIYVLGPISGGHFNPVVTLVQLYSKNINPKDASIYIGAQVLGSITGTIIANVMYGINAIQISTNDLASIGTFTSEVLATAGLIIIIGLLLHRGQESLVPIAVAGWLGAAYLFSSSTAYANPALAIGRIFSDTFAGISPISMLPFILAQIIGAALGVLAIKGLVKVAK